MGRRTSIERETRRSKHSAKSQKSNSGSKNFLIFILWLGIICCIAGLFLLYGPYRNFREWLISTAMSTMNHQYLATWFMSDTEINEIMKSLEVVNNENSELNVIELPKEEEQVSETPKENKINVDRITGSNYVGFVMTVSDPSKIKFVDSRKKNMGTKLSEICKTHDAIAGINASGFDDPDGCGMGHVLNEPAIIDRKLLYGSPNTRMSLIGLTEQGELVLGKYTYQEAMDIGIVSGLQFGPFIIVNGHKQIQKANAGGLHPRMAIGQKKDGTMIFVCIDGRQPGYSIGATQLELQNIFEKYDAYNAANLDGGSSATMYYDGKIVNKTSTPAGERYLPNAIIVTK